MRAARAAVAGELGFVPTMGALHAGHIKLIERAKQECGTCAASIFVNPTQFNDKADFARYPRTMATDVKALAGAGCDIAFAPDANEMYGDGFATAIDVGPVAQPLEGAMRPGHFTGVATVVCKLLNIVQPTRAYFGQKDAQQLVVIRRLVQDLNLPVEIVAVPTVRESDGLAMSSRNAHLSPDDRRAAPVLHRALTTAEDAYANGEHDARKLRVMMTEILAAEDRATVEYVSVADPLTLAELETIGEAGALASMAVRFGTTRLIDNAVLGG